MTDTASQHHVTHPPGTLDPSQRAVLDADASKSLTVIGAPGTGKTTTLVELLAHRVKTGFASADEVLALVPVRSQAATLRDRIAARIGGSVSSPRARTPQSLAFEIVRDIRARHGEVPPVLLTGADDDAMIRDLVDGHEAPAQHYGFAAPLTDEVLRLAGFRAELRALKSAMHEYDVTPEELASLANHHPAWAGAARMLSELETVLGWERESAYDVPTLLLDAASMLHTEPRREGSAVDRLRLVVVDDAQELTEAARRLLVALEERGVTIVTFGDPDIATGTYRGGAAERATGWRGAGSAPAPRLVLSTVHRHDAAIRGLVSGVIDRIGVRGEGRHRAAVASAASSPNTTVGTVVSDTHVVEARRIGVLLRRLHLERDIPWREMAVLTRSTSALPTLGRLLARAEVPTSAVRAPDAATDPAVVAIMGIAQAAAAPSQLTGEHVQAFLESPLFGIDGLRIRQLRRALRLRELETGGQRGSDALLVDEVRAPLGAIDLDAPMGEAPDQRELSLPARHPAAVALRRLAAMLRRAGDVARDGAADEVLWAVWEGSGVAERWRERALAGGAEGEAADARLDAVVALFDAAKRVVERSPESSIDSFIASWRDRDVETDSLSRRTDRDAVTLATPASVVGREFRVVVVAGVNEGAWPNLRLRDTLLGAQHLIEVVTGRRDDDAIIDRRRDVLDDESRVFAQALSRAREVLYITALEGEEGGPSPFFRRLGVDRVDADHLALPATLRELTATLRREARAVAARGDDPATPVSALARLARAGVPGAHPDDWQGIRDPSSTRPLVDLTGASGDPEITTISPSALERFEECGVEWFVSRFGGGETTPEMSLGTLVHASAEFAFPTLRARLDYVESRFDELQAEAPWREAALHGRVAAMVTAVDQYLRANAREGFTPLATERRFEINIPVREGDLDVTVRVNGVIDRIEEHPEEGVRIVDFKTARSPVSKPTAEASPQLAAYQFAARRDAILDDTGEHRADDPAPRVDRGGAVHIEPDHLMGAALIQLSANPGSTQFAPLQEPQTDAAEREIEQRLVRAALGMAGLLLEPPTTAEEGIESRAPLVYETDALEHAAFTAHPETHCEQAFGVTRACRIHIIAEVTE